MNNLKETEWLTVNKILLELYDINDIGCFANRVLRVFRMLIPYCKGYFILLHSDGQICREYSSYMEMDETSYDKYINSYYEKDYLKYLFEISKHTTIYRDTDIMQEELRIKTDFYREYLRPNHIPYGAGVVLCSNKKIIGIMNYFRDENLGDFTDKDMFILDVFKDHLSHMLVRLMKKEENIVMDKNQSIAKIALEMKLSGREEEVLRDVLEGMSNAEIAEKLSISLSTVKKHVYHIFTKFGVNTRTQLRGVIGKMKV